MADYEIKGLDEFIKYLSPLEKELFDTCAINTSSAVTTVNLINKRRKEQKQINI